MRQVFKTRLLQVFTIMALLVTNVYGDSTGALPANSKLCADQGYQSQAIVQSRGQTVYVPVYSHTFIGEGETRFNLAATVSLRNTDQNNPITITRLDYYDSAGRLVRKYLEKVRVLPPMASMRVTIKESDTSGGDGASFIADWRSPFPVSQPLVESIMIGTRQQQGISFISRGVAVANFD